MQVLTDPPRQSLTAAQVTALLTGDTLRVDAGLELLDASNRLVSDISDDLMGGSVSRANYADVHGTCSLKITRQLVWGKDRVRPYMTLANSDRSVTARFNMGVYLCTSPETPRALDPVTYDVAGYDLIYLLQSTGPGDTFVISAGTTYLSAVQAVLSAAQTSVPLNLDGTLGSTQLPNPMVWALVDPAPTWLRIANDLLAAINYRALWADQDGTYRSGPYLAPASRAVEWTFNTNDTNTNLIGEDRSVVADAWGVPNWWRFVRTNMSVKPVEGAGLYTVTNQGSGPTSIDYVGRTIRKVVNLDAADQASLVAQGDRLVAEDKQVSRRFEVQVDPLPIAGHFDVVQLVDAGSSDKCVVTNWEIPLDGSPGAWTLEAVG